MPRKKNKRKAAQAVKKTQKPETKQVISIAHRHSHPMAAAIIAAMLTQKEGKP